ncbi:uncharacterized protein LOC105843597 [Hydra vulgaris]|uniref:uncharacterized protein LOC105843597 n=1 Tax=Hydra vulgaris TaxID=6087 RepID=UPI001F5FA15F|nr:uncharacterized protein LOC105843597 [Hydra vulgaris]
MGGWKKDIKNEAKLFDEMGLNMKEAHTAKVAVVKLDEKYGLRNQGVFATQNIHQGEVIFRCDPSVCDYDNADLLKTKDEMNEYFVKFPQCKEYIVRYTHMVDHDTYVLPKNWEELKLECICTLFNHSCQPNSALVENDHFVALRDIAAGEELTYDYQTLETEASLDVGLNCKCGSDNCRGVLLYDLYRNDKWQSMFYDYCSPYVKDQIDNLKTRWFSSECYVKRLDGSQLGLVATKAIAKNTLVAIFSNDVRPELHYLRPSIIPNCIVIENKVFTAKDIKPGEEMTLDYTKLNNQSK